MTGEEQNESSKDSQADTPTLQSDPERELELKLKKHPEDLDAKADVGSDQSMDASDPSAATQPGGSGPAPSSSFPEK